MRILQENDVPLLHRAACKEFVSLVQKAFRDSCNSHLLLYPVEQNPSTPCKRRPHAIHEAAVSRCQVPAPGPEYLMIRRYLFTSGSTQVNKDKVAAVSGLQLSLNSKAEDGAVGKCSCQHGTATVTLLAKHVS